MEGRPVWEGALSASEALRQLSPELFEQLRAASGRQYLQTLAHIALEPNCAEWAFFANQPLFVDTAARWLELDPQVYQFQVISAFSRVLPFAPYLRSFARRYCTIPTGPLSVLAGSKELKIHELDNDALRDVLLALFRLLSFDLETFSSVVSPLQLQSLFHHSDKCVRYLTIRCLAMYMHAADEATERMLQTHLKDEPVYGPWEGITIDYRLLGLWEERRWQILDRNFWRKRRPLTEHAALEVVQLYGPHLAVGTANIGGVLVPKLSSEAQARGSVLVKTPTVLKNLHKIGEALLSSKPLLLVGLPNSGKTSLVNDVANALGQGSSMVTLHLNEQTDAKSLLGMYATSSMTGAFTWQPGVLTKAAREGRWVLIEDLDRAPAEVVGLILPILERGELIIPMRRERIKCADGFRLIATMKSSLNSKGEEVVASHGLLGMRLWQRISITSMSLDEIRDIISQKFPLLSSRTSILMELFDRICTACNSNLAVRSSQGRTPGLRDLIKLCNRIHRRLKHLGAETGNEPVPESFQDEMFLDAVDVLFRYLPDKALFDQLASIVAEVLQLSPQRARYCLHERTPRYEDGDSGFVIGREAVSKEKVSKAAKARYSQNASRFAPTRAALKTMEQIAASVQVAEPVLLVGETGIGKTAAIQQLANMMHQKLTVVNLSQQSESTDLLGGFRPVNLRSMAVPLLDDFSELFEHTFPANKKNDKFMPSVTKCIAKGDWQRLISHWRHAIETAYNAFEKSARTKESTEEQPSKKRKLNSSKYAGLREKWEAFEARLKEFEAQARRGDSKFAFAFVQGKIVRALRNGEWVLLDEINLATPDILESIASLLHHGDDGVPSVLLSEAGDVERVYGHPNFRIFGAMNPATDAGKRDLTPGLRSRFTELYIYSPDSEMDDLLGLIRTYLGDLAKSDPHIASDLAHLYLATKQLAMENRLTDGAGQKPHFSIRTLVRTLVYVVDHVQIYGIRRSAYEGYCMSFLTILSQESEKLVTPLIHKHLFGNRNPKAILSQQPKPPNDGHEYVQFKHYWMRKGPFAPEAQPHYIITPSIEKNLKNLLRASSTRRFPILLQGPTSSGKTSMVEYLAKISGNKCVRINNHEHTDLQEYLGSYVSTEDGTLRYQEGVLVEALRNGYWIVLDELNLAPSDVLEALNRLLDDNRELFLPETQEVIRPHANFMLFATQNPAGLYGGRKVLSRAFRNRFLELHFDDIPEDELEIILTERTQIAPSFCRRIVSVYKELSVLRQSTRLFEQKNSFATLRDLFRWALRQADDQYQLAINGFMLLAERVRNAREREAVKKIIEKVMRVQIDEDAIYSEEELARRINAENLSKDIVWTKAMRRVFILVSQALQNKEPVLLVGETGCGKTQVCQAIAAIHGKELFTVNAHANLETGDLIGAQRPLRNRSRIEHQLADDIRLLLSSISSNNDGLSLRDLGQLKDAFARLSPEQLANSDAALLKRIRTNMARSQALFEWSDGSLISAMKAGQYFLLDEISLADDSVLERLNSVLEPHRSILLAEKGPIDSLVVAEEGFQFMSTMNPGGDYGKRELSAALRNRLTEIWVPQLSEDEDILPILTGKLADHAKYSVNPMLEFAKWFRQTIHNSSATSVSIRDLLAWVDFVNKWPPSELAFALVHGAAMVYIDTLGANPAAMISMPPEALGKNRTLCLEKLSELLQLDAASIYYQDATVTVEHGHLCVGPFKLPMSADSTPDPQFVMDAPTTLANAVRIARGLQSSKPILLEGSPGVGKTTLVASLARALGKPLTRINLSEQTDLADLFGSDVPVEGGDVGQFAWRDAPFLQAMQRGEWVLLDEMNLASQSVLEGLNSCLDHRQQVYVAELDQTFKRHPDFVLFAAQNPHHQGGGRKGLPASFVNRFTVVYADAFNHADLKKICAKLFPGSPMDQTSKVVDFVSELNAAIVRDRRIGAIGGPWEMNLRDITRWLQLSDRGQVQVPCGHFLENIISHRFRTPEDRALIAELFAQSFGESPPFKSLYHDLSPTQFQVGFGFMPRDSILQHLNEPNLKILPDELPILESLMLCVERAWPSILVGASGCGKTTILRKLAAINGAKLVELALSADTDTMDLIGGFEQIDHRRKVASIAMELESILLREVITALSRGTSSAPVSELMRAYAMCRDPNVSLETLLSCVSVIRSAFPDLSLDDLMHRCNSLAHLAQNANKVGFEWTEGALTEAIQRGYWVVLDNANLCNASVLDRLNSLMEPNGYLVLNEQKTEDGSARVITPHPNFRLFLTMDPRNGELSRAMRNRSVEICFLPSATQSHDDAVWPCYITQSALYRLRHVFNGNQVDTPTTLGEKSVEVRLDHLAISDFTHHGSIRRNIPSTVDDNDRDRLLDRYFTVMEENTQLGLTAKYSRELQRAHPLVNEPGLIVHSVNFDKAAAIALLQELRLDLYRLQQKIDIADGRSKVLKPSQMTRLERSLASVRISSLKKDSTQPVGQFLRECSSLLQGFIRDSYSIDLVSAKTLAVLRAIFRFCWDIFVCTQSTELDDAEFRTYLRFGEALLSSAGDGGSGSALLSNISQFLSLFSSNWALSTGLSMQRIWDAWRPVTCTNNEQLQSLIDLEEIASTFATVALQTRLPLAQLGDLRQSLLEAQDHILVNGADGRPLVQSLTQQVGELASATDMHNTSQPPHFSAIFESLCEYHDLLTIWDGDPVLKSPGLSGMVPLLAGRPAQPADSSPRSSVPAVLQKLAYYSGADATSRAAEPWTGAFCLSLLQRMAEVDDVTLGRLEFLENEEAVLAQTVALSTHAFTLDQTSLLARILAKLCIELLEVHRDLVTPESFSECGSWLHRVGIGEMADVAPPVLHAGHSISDQHYPRAFADDIWKFMRELAAIQTGSKYNLGRAAVHLAVILLRLFVPDRQNDPSLELVIQRRRHAEQVAELNAKDKALMAFELEFTGRADNLRRRLVQKELQELGSEPPAAPVTRPAKSQLAQLQSEFTSLLNSVINRQPETYGPTEFREYGGLLRDNIKQICRRLRQHFRVYDDITVLVTRFLQLLDLGISLCLASIEAKPGAKCDKIMSELIPRLDLDEDLVMGNPAFEASGSKLPLDVQLQKLSRLVAAHHADSTFLNGPGGLQSLREMLQFIYQIWKAQLQQDQKEEAERSRTYRYRGSFEDEEEINDAELRALFPTFEEGEEDQKEKPRLNHKALSARLCAIHAAIFESRDAQIDYRDYVVGLTRVLESSQLGTLTPSEALPKMQLPGVLLLLNDDKKRFQEVPSRTYSFYSDPNIPEAKRLVSLTLSVQSRFLQLQKAWPEHAAIRDVLICCQEILQFRHLEPVAKFITKLEKLHAYVHEWQLVASREYSAAAQFDEITAMIIRWRRLELSTWAKLLDVEFENCERDVSSWWFVAYEVLVAVPFQMLESGGDLVEYSKEMLATLEGFFKSTTLGQYGARLRLLESFRSLLAMYTTQFPALASLVSPVDNFLRHYRPFLSAIAKSLADGRQSLEKDIKEQIQLASWKDTNITALRESARRSHHKLFKYVRKYRELLAQPTEPILQRGMPEEQDEHEASTSEEGPMPSVDFSAALAVCEKNEPIWTEQAQRFKDPLATSASMNRVFSRALPEFNSSSQLESFAADVIDTVKELKAKTPGTLTEENKADVQHLKAQKRRFYAETLRQLHVMGIRRNIGTLLLEEQSSVSQVLATTPSITSDDSHDNPDIRSADSYFHRFLDLLPRVRQASRDYNEELNPTEVTRSVGSAEGFLLMMRKQRETIFPVRGHLTSLKQTARRIRTLWNHASSVHPDHSSQEIGQVNVLKRHVSQFIPIFGVAIEVLDIHSRFSATPSAADVLRGWRDQLVQLNKDIDILPELPVGITSQNFGEKVQRAGNILGQLRSDMLRLMDERHDLRFVLEQIVSWTHIPAKGAPASTAEGSLAVEVLNSEFLSVLNKILVALQGMPSVLSSMPTTVEEKEWLSLTDSAFAKAFKQLHLKEISTSLNAVLEKLALLQPSESGLSLACAILAGQLPIVDQYISIAENLVRRYISLHREVCKMSYILSKTFVQIASEGFCSPLEESAEGAGAEGKLESGTGLGDGEGVEDISKDIEDDEDLTELAQQENQERGEGDMEKPADAVNMDQEDLEGEFDKDRDDAGEDEEGEDGSEKEEGNEDDLDEEVGSVDDLDPNAVDEKLWEGEHEEGQKDTENQEAKGKAKGDDQAAAGEDKGQEHQEGDEAGEEGDEEEEAPEDEAEAVGMEPEMDVTDPHAKEEQTLDLPEDIQLDGDDKEGKESDVDDDMSDLDDPLDEPKQEEPQPEPEDGKEEDVDEGPTSEVGDATMEEDDQDEVCDDEEGMQVEQEGEEPAKEEPTEQPEEMQGVQREDDVAAAEEVAPSDAVTGGMGADQDPNMEKGESGDAQQQGGSTEAGAETQPSGAAEEGQRERAKDTSGGRSDDAQDDPQSQAFKKLGDVLEQWHRRQREILNSSTQADSQALPPYTDMADADFEHLADENDVADTEALGQASEEQAKALDQRKGVESEPPTADQDQFLPDVTEDKEAPEDKPSLEEAQMDIDTAEADQQTGAKDAATTSKISEAAHANDGVEPTTEEQLDQVDSHLAAIHLSSSQEPRMSAEEARELWTRYEAATNDLSLSLTEQLRLILAPTLATKLRGDFRTGKRLNIKRIIPYIASQYKRDKIWMRRTIPSKRNYQVMLAVDDSKSMQESGCGRLAFETLALVARSLSMLEVGDLCIVSFGDEEHVRVAHEFGKPFSSEAGTQVFQQFSYQQTGTNVRRLVEDSIALFREARARRSGSSSGSSSSDLWQLELIISDGLCEDHDTIRRLVRQAAEERIMMVFIILDPGAAKGNSILDLKHASFEPDANGTGELKLKMKSYLEGFPFSYYLLVRDVRELPSVLAMALKQWFSEVVDST
ncbi:hypothetical protein VTN31DRAFT_7070 [Thermomyces dupontii]|uniref:uncharacterized protein n=1 Tax=Talaromyces thermophilus TaxID=28565 RepID=UPI0037431C6E